MKNLPPVTSAKGFWIGQTEVTVGAYKRFASSHGQRDACRAEFQQRVGE